MIVVPLQTVPNQTLAVPLGGQACQLNVYQTPFGLFMDVYANGSLVIQGVLCLNANRIVRDLYLGFVGDFSFYDTQGSSDPDYAGIGGASARYQLIYLETTDLDGEG